MYGHSKFNQTQFGCVGVVRVVQITVDKRIRLALMPLGLDIYNGVYLGNSKKYLVFNYATVGVDYADDEAGAEKYLCQVHLYAMLNDDISDIKKLIKKKLRNAGFTHPETSDASDEAGRHIVFEFEWVEGWIDD